MEKKLRDLTIELKNENISLSEFSSWALKAVGFQSKEIGDKTNTAKSTAEKHLSNAKLKLPYSKDTELSGYFICRLLNIDYEELRERVIHFVESELANRITSICIIIGISFSISSNNTTNFETRRSRRMFNRPRIETIYDIDTTSTL